MKIPNYVNPIEWEGLASHPVCFVTSLYHLTTDEQKEMKNSRRNLFNLIHNEDVKGSSFILCVERREERRKKEAVYSGRLAATNPRE